MTPSLQTAQLLHAHGVACIPCNADKTPRIKSWSPYRATLPTSVELERWFATDVKLALIAGRVQCLDFDEKYSTGILARYAKRAEETGLDQLIGGLIQQLTPSGGYHLVWQCDSPRIGNLKLAQKANNDTLIETRGDGGYFLIAPSEGYKLLNGDWSSIPTISEDDRDALLNLARTFDERVPVEAHVVTHDASSGVPVETTPGDDFDFRADMPAMLRKHGWKPTGRDDKYWTRPGKSKGISASWDVVPGRFFVFSSSTEFEPQHVYRPWHVYAILECGKDYARAAGELRRQGFGGVTAPKASASSQILPPDWMPAIETAPEGVVVDPAGEAPTVETREEKLRRLWSARRFNPSVKPPELRVRFSLNGVPISTPRNLTAITAQAKVGKSALLQGFTAATLTPVDRDCLSVVGFNEHNHAVIYVDTEQADDDFWRAMDKAKIRAGIDSYPSWLTPHCLSDLPVKEIREGLAVRMADAQAEHGGIHSVFIDGVADMVLDVNDAGECNELVSDLFRLAKRYDCAIICVIHKNPGSDKTRGHLGSQIERKAETNLTLEKEETDTVVWSIKQRRAPIFKKDGPRFRWSEEAGMHVSVNAPVKGKATLKAMDLLDMAVEAFNSAPHMTYSGLVQALIKTRDMSEPTAKRKVAEMRKLLVLETNSIGQYLIKKDEFPT